MGLILETKRLRLRELEADRDAQFVCELLNTPKFIKYIGDRGVRSTDDARDFIADRYAASYRDHGYGLYAVETLDCTKVGICGFVKRDYFDHPDIGFAFLPEHEGRGYGKESAAAVMHFGREKLGFTKVLGITSLDNETSAGLLVKNGFQDDGIIEPQGEKLRMFSYTFDQ
ncbi:MAG TPA: GNAT family N-acetyltransferase [Pyrinomonadaceae bacterium]|jgi:RimJ/RimL family protein N-acetyltransferase|nr:GNAT family N-acetyltransferase [Pyrinomonadaceae bacterium]